MQLRNDERRYGVVAQGFHWLIAALVLATVVVALYMTGLPLGPQKVKVYNLHKSIGVTILVLTILRLLWRLVSPAPALLAGMSWWERTAARLSHLALYGILLVQPVVGIVHSWSASFPVVVFGLFTLPSLTAPDPELKKLLEALHGAIGWGFIALISLHAAAALRHHLLLKDEVLRRMLPGGGP
jgi:cytochrome b561